MSAIAGGAVSPRHRLPALLAVFAASLLAMLDLSISAVSLPVIRNDLNASLAGLQWTFDAYALAFASLLLVGGLISDRLGHRTGLMVSTSLFVVGSALCAFANGLGMLIAGRGVQGAAAAMLVPASMAMIARLAGGANERAKLLGIWSGLSGAAIALGPILGGWLVHVAGWRIIFQINLPIGLMVLVLIMLTVPKVNRAAEGRLDTAGLLLGALWAFALAYGIIEGNAKGWTSPLIVGAFVLAAVGLVVFLVVERRSEHPMMPVTLFKSRSFASAGIIAFVLGLGLSSSFYFLSLFLQQVLGYSSLGAGLGFLPAALALTVMAPVSGQLFRKYGPRLLIAVGLVLGGVGLFGISLADADGGYGQLWWAVALIGIGWGLSLPPVNTVALGSVPPERTGGASGTIETALQFGTVVGIALLGAIQAGGFIRDLRARLTEMPIAGTALNRSVDLLATGRVAEVTGVPTNSLSRITAQAFAHGLHLAFLVGALITVATAAVALIGTPRTVETAGTKQEQPEVTDEPDSTVVQP